MDQAQELRNIIKKEQLVRPVARVITVTSGKGGVGKSSICVNLGIQLQKLGKRVVILDADFGLANIEVMLGIRPQFNLAHLLFKGKSLNEIITHGPEGIQFISGGSGIRELTNLNRDQIIHLTQSLKELDEIADIILVDTGAGIDDSVMEFVVASTEVLIVATPEPTSITDAYALLKTIDKRREYSPENTLIHMLSNRVNSYEEGKELYRKMNVVVEKFLSLRMDYLGSIPQDPMVSQAVMKQTPFSLLYPNSLAGFAMLELAAMLNENIKREQKERGGIARFFANLFRMKGEK